MSDKRKWQFDDAAVVAAELMTELYPACERLVIAGSIRRRKPLVGDIELVFVPKMRPIEGSVDFFTAPGLVSCADDVLRLLIQRGIICPRVNAIGGTAWGEKNKLGVHRPSGIPVDFFATTEASFFNYLVCRTGGAQTNIRIAAEAKARGWKWNPYGQGFTRRDGPDRGRVHVVTSEREVFDFAKVPWLEPEERP